MTFGTQVQKAIIGVAACIGLIGIGDTAQAQTASWKVQMTSKQAKAYKDFASYDGNRAFAISPDGAWGFTYGKRSKAQAETQAMAHCRKHMRNRQRDCLLFDVNGTRLLPDVTQTYKVAALYVPVDAKGAAAVFGLAGGQFKGNKAQAKAAYKSFGKGRMPRAALASDPALTSLLKGRSLMTKKSRATTIWFGDPGATQLVRGVSTIASNQSKAWIAASSGLVCLFDGVWDSGKIIGDRCLFIESIANGQVRFSGASSWAQSNKAQLVAGDASYAAVR